MNDKLHLFIADWHSLPDQAALRLIRTSVFIHEQRVPAELEWDGEDANAVHLLMKHENGQAIACARLVEGSELNQVAKNSGKIGRMAVLPQWRHQGMGRALLAFAITTLLQRQVSTIVLSAQVQAIGFYQQAGFDVCSDPYLDAGILHVDMQLNSRELSLLV